MMYILASVVATIGFTVLLSRIWRSMSIFLYDLVEFAAI